MHTMYYKTMHNITHGGYTFYIVDFFQHKENFTTPESTEMTAFVLV